MFFGRKPTDLTSARIDGLADEVVRWVGERIQTQMREANYGEP